MARRYDVIILGVGNAGMAAARVAREHGKSVAMVDCRPVGGTCPLRGCVPKKVLVAAAEALDEIAKASQHHIETGPARLNWAGLIDRERSFVEGKSESFAESLKGRGIDLYDGTARFVGRTRIAVGEAEFEAGKIVIATGSMPRPLPFAGAEHMIISDDLLIERTLPDSLAFIGGGVIALEFSHVFARAGCKVTILEVAPRLLPAADAEAAAVLREATEKLGIEVLTEVEVEAIEPDDSGFKVRFRHEGTVRTLAAQRVANGAGRIPDVEALDLGAAGIEHERTRIALDDRMRSRSNPDVYVAGDAVAETAQLSPLATHEGRAVGNDLVGAKGGAIDYLAVPSVVFTVPALASVGLTEAQARDQGVAFEAKQSDMRGWLSSRLYGAEVAYAKVLNEPGSGRILGAHLVGKRSEEVIHLFALAIRQQLTRSDLTSLVYAFPTFSSDLPSML
jgi:glutathione reductase (NADPH)